MLRGVQIFDADAYVMMSPKIGPRILRTGPFAKSWMNWAFSIPCAEDKVSGFSF